MREEEEEGEDDDDEEEEDIGGRAVMENGLHFFSHLKKKAAIETAIGPHDFRTALFYKLARRFRAHAALPRFVLLPKANAKQALGPWWKFVLKKTTFLSASAANTENMALFL